MDVEGLLAAEDAGWLDLCAAFDRLTPEQLEHPGITPDGWSAKDVMFHVACWIAECGLQLERIRMGTFEHLDESVDAMNRRWFELSRTMDAATVRTEFIASRTRMIAEFGTLIQATPDAIEWFEESGALHYAEHLEDLRSWSP